MPSPEDRRRQLQQHGEAANYAASSTRGAGPSRGVALQSVYAGLGLSLAGMVFAAALGYLTPVQGALLQEAIDIAVILNALRTLR